MDLPLLGAWERGHSPQLKLPQLREAASRGGKQQALGSASPQFFFKMGDLVSPVLHHHDQQQHLFLRTHCVRL